MSSSTVRVELPAYSHSFQVQVTPSSTIRDVKQEIAKACPGSPSPEGQRLVCRGRFLKDDEKVEDIWKSLDDLRVIHLAVHPSAWSSTPPTLPSATSSGLRPTPTQPRASTGQPAPTPTWQSHLPQPANSLSQLLVPLTSMNYIQHLHSMALAVLSAGAVTLPRHPTVNELDAWRSAAKELYRSRGWTWPNVYEGPFPSGSSEQGAVYEPVTLEGLPYLQLTTPGATPTPAQLHAIQVLSYTFPIISMANDPMLYAPSNPYPFLTQAMPMNVSERLQQLGLPALRLAHNQAANLNPNDANNHNPNPLAPPGAAAPELRAAPLRTILIPLLMLAFRTILLLYFFSPSKRPLFGLILSAWILYEAYNAFRLVMHDGNWREAEGLARRGPPGPVAGAGAGPAPAQAAGEPQLDANGIHPNVAVDRSGANAVLERLSTLNLAAEDALLETDAPAPAPGVVQKTKMFVSLFFMTLWPSAWDRRRNALRRREGHIRTEASAREVPVQEREQGSAEEQTQEQEQRRSEEDEARTRAREQLMTRHERRPAWLKQYVERVQYTEWVDDQ